MTDKLSQFEGLDVREAGIEIPGAAGGLRESMKIDPQEFHKGESVRVLLDCVVGKVRFDPIDKDEPAGDQRRVHIFAVENAVIVPSDFGSTELEAAAERIRLAKEEEQGVQRLPYGEDLQMAHDAGEHAAGLVDGCPDCDEEKVLETEERETELV